MMSQSCGSGNSGITHCSKSIGGCSPQQQQHHGMQHGMIPMHRGEGQHHCRRVQVTLEVPDFEAKAVMPDGSFQDISLSQYRGKYVLLYFYPMDWTFVCPTEIVGFSDMTEAFEQKNVQVLACSVDSHYSHKAWRDTSRNEGGVGQIKHPMIADINKSISRMFGVLLENQGIALRGLFLIDKKGILRHSLINDLPLGRSVEEAMRMVDALQFTEEHGEVCPLNWKKNQPAIKPTREGVANYLKSS